MKTISRQTINSIVGLFFVISGSIGLVYQIVWFKYLSLFLGNTTHAQTIVLATFMGGLAIGSALFGRKADNSPKPLRLYAWLELGIALYCLVYPAILDYLKNQFISAIISFQLPIDGIPVFILKIFVCIGSLLIPTILMGGTLPVLVRFTSKTLYESGRNVAVLYFLNSFGAIMGSLLAGFFFIRILGLSITIYSAGIGSLLIGGSAFMLSTLHISRENLKLARSKETKIFFSRREVVLAVSVAGISGLAAMIYEVTWVRLLIPVLGSSTYSFSLMLVAFISGITIGSYVASIFIQKFKNLIFLLGWCQVCVAFSMLLILPVYSRVPYEFWKIGSMIARNNFTYPFFLAIQFFFCFVLMIIPTIFLGASLPLAARIASNGIDKLGKSVGNIFAVNTIGTVIGALSAGLALIPLVGIRHTLEIGVVLNLFCGLLIFVFDRVISRIKLFVLVSGLIVVSTMYYILAPNWNKNVFLFGVYRFIHSNVHVPDSYSDFERSVTKANRVLFCKEGASANVGVTENSNQTILVVNGKPDASSREDLPTQLLCGQIPCLLNNYPQNVLVVGLGSGVTVGSVLTHPVKRVDCVEILQEVVDASSMFNKINNDPLKDRRLNLFIEDALAFLKIMPQKYDVIINEPTNPWIAGVGNLFTTEFFETCKQRMNRGGCMVQWFHLYEMDDEIFKMIVRTFKSSFSNVSIWHPVNEDIIMIGSDEPLAVDYNRIRSVMSKKEIKDDLKRIGINDMAALLSLEALSSGSVERYIGMGELNTEDRPYLEYSAPRAFFLNARVRKLAVYDERIRLDSSVYILLKNYSERSRLTNAELRNIGFYHTDRSDANLRFGYAILHQLHEKRQDDTALLERLVKTAERLNLTDETANYLRQLVKLVPKNPEVLEKYAWLKYSIERGRGTMLTPIDIEESKKLIQTCISLTADTVDSYRIKMAEMFYGIQEYENALEQYKRALTIRDKYPVDENISDDFLLLQIARCYYNMNQNDRALSYVAQAVSINRENEDAGDLLYEIWSKGTISIKTE